MKSARGRQSGNAVLTGIRLSAEMKDEGEREDSMAGLVGKGKVIAIYRCILTDMKAPRCLAKNG